jgi:hypothetical protein
MSQVIRYSQRIMTCAIAICAYTLVCPIVIEVVVVVVKQAHAFALDRATDYQVYLNLSSF